MENETNSGWKQSEADIFWGEISPSDHILQIYENDEVFLDALTGFVGTGIHSGDSCIVIATDVHLQALNSKLENWDIDVQALVADHRYIPLNAEEILSKFMRKGWPDETLFIQTVSELLVKARGHNNRRVRAFGEMVALLWAQGYNGATVHLEHLWNKFCQSQAFCLFCAYPKVGFTEDMADSITHICGAHAKMISGSKKQLNEIFYSDVVKKAI
jgi:hypothetical protein